MVKDGQYNCAFYFKDRDDREKAETQNPALD
jgi:hypothetical protein